MYLITKWFGTFLCNKIGIQKKILFPKDEKEIAKRLKLIEKKEILPEEKKITKNIQVNVSEKRLYKIGDYTPSDSFFKDFEIKPDDFDYSMDLLHKASLMLSEDQVDEKLESEDLQIIQMVNTLDDFIQTANLLSERLECWKVLPVASKKIEPLQSVFSTVNSEIKKLVDQIDVDMEKIAPNTCMIVGPLIGARLIALSGGLQKLAMVPASTIQILGAETALFRFKKEGGKPPKHGVIFQHHLIKNSPKNIRGKISRVLATKISIAVKADVFTKRDIAKELQKSLQKRLEEIRNQ